MNSKVEAEGFIIPNAEEHQGIDNAVILVDSQIEIGRQRIKRTLANFNMAASDIFYDPCWFDGLESQGGWGCTLDDATKQRLRTCNEQSLRNVCMLGGDDIEQMLDVIRDTGHAMTRRAIATSASRSTNPKKRTVRLELTLQEYDSLKSKAGGQSIQDYIKRKLL